MPADTTPEGNDQFNNFPGSAKSFTRQYKPHLLGILTFVILSGLIGMLVFQRLLINKEANKKETLNFVSSAKERLQESLIKGISAAGTLSFFIQKDGVIKDFDSVAAQIFAANSQIDVLQLMPGGVIRYVYPLKGNEHVIGYNLLKDSARNKEAFKAIQRKEVFYAGPFALKQGGMGVAGRIPIFRNGEFWGFSAVIIKLPTLLKAAGIDTTGKTGYYYQLSKINPDTGQEEFFITHPNKQVSDQYVSVNVHNQEWKLSAIPVDNRGAINIFWLSILGFLIAVMGGIFVFVVAKGPETLNRLVQKRTAELQESEEKYRNLIEQASDGIIVYSFDGTIHHFNKAAHNIAGYTYEEFARLNLKDLLLEKKVIIDQSRADELKAGKSANFQRKMCTKEGAIIDIEINSNLLHGGKLLAFVRNVTNRINTERALKESEEKFSKAFQSSLLSFAIYDMDEKVVDANERYAAMLETTRENIIGKNTSDTKLLNKVSIQKREVVRNTIRNILEEKGRLLNFETQIETNSGGVIYLLLSIVPLELNNQTHWLISVIDITEKKNTELSLANNEMKYRSLIQQASDGIIISNVDGIILEVNRSICTMGGYTSGEMLGRHINNFMPEEDILSLPLRIQDLIQGKTLLYERRMLKKDGTILYVDINSKMAIGNTLIGFARDITERKKGEAELRNSNERFELIARATNDAIWDHSFTTNQTVGNQNLYNLYGFTPGKHHINFEIFESRVHPDDLERIKDNMKNAIESHAVFISEEFRFRSVDGTYKHFFDRAYISYDDNGAPARVLGAMQDVTERIEDREQILKEKGLSDSIINSLPAVFYLYNKAGKFLRWNKNFEIVTGYSGEEINNLHPLDLFDDEEKKLLDKKIRNVFLSGEDNLEANFLLKNKQKIPYYFSGMKIEYEGETCLMGFGLDFSDKVKADRQIKESEQKFRSLVEQASDGVAILSETGTPLYISPSVERILGYTETESMHLNVFELIHPDDVDAAKKLFAQVMRNPGIPIKGAISRVLHKYGTWHWLEDTITNMLHIPSINGIVKNFRDVTEKLEIEKRIMNEKELSDSIINSLPGIFYLYDIDGKFLRWNKNFETVTGYTAAEIRQMHPLDFYDVDDKPAVAQRSKDVFANRRPGIEFLLLTKSGQKIPFYYNSVATEYEGAPALVGMGFDVTDRKKIERELKISNEQLEQKATELKTSFAELERFAYIVSHDLQEPLRMVSSFLKLLEQKYKDELDETAQKYIHFAVDGSDRMKQLINDLLEYSRTGTNTDIATDTNMNEVMQEVLMVLHNSIREQHAAVEVEGLPVLHNTSKIQMFQLMQNLISNALKYHSERKPLIKIGARVVDAAWVFSIQDNGIGIDPKYADKIFIIFQRLHSKTEFSGTGIGLSICKKIVEKHGGKIWVESTPGNGSTFYFSIPKR